VTRSAQSGDLVVNRWSARS